MNFFYTMSHGFVFCYIIVGTFQQQNEHVPKKGSSRNQSSVKWQ